MQTVSTNAVPIPSRSLSSLPRRVVTLILALLAASLSTAPALPAEIAEKRSVPNIVLILADDLGWRDSTVYGSTFYETPNLERLARRGMVFTNAYAANPLCSPTRSSILTGQYPGRLRFTLPAGHLPQVVLDPVLPAQGAPSQKAVTPQTRTRLPLEYHTLAEALQQAGYATGFFGKWHLGREPYMPKRQGFVVNVGGGPYPGPPSYFSPYRIHTLPDGPEGEHITDRLTDEAIRFLKANKDRPLLLNFWHYSVHAPFQAKDPLVEKYRAKADPDNPQHNPVMGAMIQTLDESVGRVLDAIDELGLADRTMIVFFSDNGGNMYNVVEGTTPTNNYPLRGGKGTIYEGGTRVPMIVVWPGHVRPGSRSDAIVSSIDFFPTLLEVAGAKAKPDQVVDGISILPALEQTGPLKREAIFCHFPHYVKATGNLPATSVRKGKWKLIRFFADGPNQQDRFELYDLEADIGESKNLAAEMPEKVAELNALIGRHLEETEALVPFPNPAYRPSIRGWHGNQNAELAQADGNLVVKATGNDPFLTTADLPQVAGPLVLELRMKSSAAREGRVYWSIKGRPGFRREQSASFDATHDGQWHDYRVRLDFQGPLVGLRIDPAQAPGDIRIESIRLIDDQGRAVKSWRFDR